MLTTYVYAIMVIHLFKCCYASLNGLYLDQHDLDPVLLDHPRYVGSLSISETHDVLRNDHTKYNVEKLPFFTELPSASPATQRRMDVNEQPLTCPPLQSRDISITKSPEPHGQGRGLGITFSEGKKERIRTSNPTRWKAFLRPCTSLSYVGLRVDSTSSTCHNYHVIKSITSLCYNNKT